MEMCPRVLACGNARDNEERRTSREGETETHGVPPLDLRVSHVYAFDLYRKGEENSTAGYDNEIKRRIAVMS